MPLRVFTNIESWEPLVTLRSPIDRTDTKRDINDWDQRVRAAAHNPELTEDIASIAEMAGISDESYDPTKVEAAHACLDLVLEHYIQPIAVDNAERCLLA